MSWWKRVVRSSGGSPPTEGTTGPTERRPDSSCAPERVTGLTLSRFLAHHPRAVIDVWAPWCGPCRAFAPVFAETASEWGEHVGFGKLNADHDPTLVVRFGVRSIPSLLYFRDGRLVGSDTGVPSRERLEKRLRRTFGGRP